MLVSCIRNPFKLIERKRKMPNNVVALDLWGMSPKMVEFSHENITPLSRIFKEIGRWFKDNNIKVAQLVSVTQACDINDEDLLITTVTYNI